MLWPPVLPYGGKATLETVGSDVSKGEGWCSELCEPQLAFGDNTGMSQWPWLRSLSCGTHCSFSISLWFKATSRQGWLGFLGACFFLWGLLVDVSVWFGVFKGMIIKQFDWSWSFLQEMPFEDWRLSFLLWDIAKKQVGRKAIIPLEDRRMSALLMMPQNTFLWVKLINWIFPKMFVLSEDPSWSSAYENWEFDSSTLFHFGFHDLKVFANYDSVILWHFYLELSELVRMWDNLKWKAGG